MVAYDSRGVPDPSRALRPETIEALRAALTNQAASGPEPTVVLADAIRAAAIEARQRSLPPESLLLQLKQLAEDILASTGEERRTPSALNEWMVRTMLQAYWNSLGA